jgi:hypothetical protein
MKYIKGFFLFWYDFIIGDAWEVAAGVVLALILVYLLLQYAAGAGTMVTVALLLPVIIMALLTFSIWRVRKPH